MAHGADTRGKTHNSTSPEEVNRGVYGKFSIEQLAERTELHARRFHTKFPEIQDICDHFQKKHGITVHYQSEKEWARTDKNKARILAKQEEMIHSGELEIETLSNQTLLNSLSESARQEAQLITALRSKIGHALRNFDADFQPWKILDIPKKLYLSGTKEQKKEWKSQVEIELAIKKNIVDVVKALGGVLKDNAEEVRKTVKQAFEMSNKVYSADQANKKVNKITQHQDAIEEAGAEGAKKGSEEINIEDVDLEKLRVSAHGS